MLAAIKQYDTQATFKVKWALVDIFVIAALVVHYSFNLA